MHKISTNVFRHPTAGILCLLLLALTGCADDLINYTSEECDDPGREVWLPVTIDVAEMVTLTDATRYADDDPNMLKPVDLTVLEDEKRLHDYWILQYNSAGNRVGEPHYQIHTEGENPLIPFLIPTRPNAKFTTVVIGNTGDPALFNDKNSGTIRALKDTHKPMKNADDVWIVIDGNRHLLMSGKTEVDINTVSLNATLQPNVAKLHLIFRLMKVTDGEGDAGGGNSWDRKRKTLGVNWGNVPDIPYADILFEADSYDDEASRYPSTVNPANLNLFPITTDPQEMSYIRGYSLDMSDKPSSIDVYLPRNTQGTSRNTDPYTKCTYATDNALYLELVTADKEETQRNKWRSIHFLPGANTVDDYNIIPGKYYVMDCTFSNFPTDDGPVYKFYRRYGEANAYIVDPNDTHIVNRFPISPANNYATGVYPTSIKKTYWEETYYNIYLQELQMVDNDKTGKLTQDPATWKERDIFFTDTKITGSIKGLPFAIMPSTEWVAEVIWQDRPQRLINFCDYLGLPTHDGDYYESAGAMWLPVKTYELKMFKQTFLPLGRPTDDIMDPSLFKDPTNDRNPTRSEIFFKTTGEKGNVVVGIRKKTEQEKGGGAPPPLVEREYLWSWHLWITDYNPAALGHTTMDRNIGAIEPGDAGFYYQFDRKDPFPDRNAKVYDIHGRELSQLRHDVGPEGATESASMLIYQHDGKTPTAAEAKKNAKLKGVRSPFTLIYHTDKTTSTSASTVVSGTAKKDYKDESPTNWSLPTSLGLWVPEDPTPQGWVLPPDEKQLETPPGFWTIAASWEGMSIPASGLRSDPYTSTDVDYIYRPGVPFLWIKPFGTATVNKENTGLVPNTDNVKSPLYPEGFKMKVDALPVRCVRLTK